VGICVFVSCLAFVPGQFNDVAADTPARAVLLDGLSALAGGRYANESDSIPVLVSDVALEASFLLVIRLGPAGLSSTVTEQLRRRARQRAVMIRVLAQRAKRLDESVAGVEIKALKKTLTDRAGGKDAMNRLLNRFGASDVDLSKWAENTLLAAAQIRYAKEQSEDQGEGAVAKWLNEVVALAQARILR
jgi:hypothetical protein